MRIVKKLGLTNRNGNTSHMHTHAHMLITILLKAKTRMNIGLTYFWKCFRWIGVEIVCMLISQLLLLYMWEAFTHTHIFCLCAWFISNVRIFLWDLWKSMIISWKNDEILSLIAWMCECVNPLWTNLLGDNMWSIC